MNKYLVLLTLILTISIVTPAFSAGSCIFTPKKDRYKALPTDREYTIITQQIVDRYIEHNKFCDKTFVKTSPDQFVINYKRNPKTGKCEIEGIK